MQEAKPLRIEDHLSAFLLQDNFARLPGQVIRVDVRQAERHPVRQGIAQPRVLVDVHAVVALRPGARVERAGDHAAARTDLHDGEILERGIACDGILFEQARDPEEIEGRAVLDLTIVESPPIEDL